MIETKRCFKCKRVKLLWLFIKQPKGAYMRESEKGVSINCKRCVLKSYDGSLLETYIDERGRRNFRRNYMTKLQAIKKIYL